MPQIAPPALHASTTSQLLLPGRGTGRLHTTLLVRMGQRAHQIIHHEGLSLKDAHDLVRGDIATASFQHGQSLEMAKSELLMFVTQPHKDNLSDGIFLYSPADFYKGDIEQFFQLPLLFDAGEPIPDPFHARIIQACNNPHDTRLTEALITENALQLHSYELAQDFFVKYGYDPNNFAAAHHYPISKKILDKGILPSGYTFRLIRLTMQTLQLPSTKWVAYRHAQFALIALRFIKNADDDRLMAMLGKMELTKDDLFGKKVKTYFMNLARAALGWAVAVLLSVVPCRSGNWCELLAPRVQELLKEIKAAQNLVEINFATNDLELPLWLLRTEPSEHHNSPRMLQLRYTGELPCYPYLIGKTS